MKVWVAIYFYYEDTYPKAVFSSKKKAEAWVKKQDDACDFQIEEFELDANH
jgi:hypothetical protein